MIKRVVMVLLVLLIVPLVSAMVPPDAFEQNLCELRGGAYTSHSSDCDNPEFCPVGGGYWSCTFGKFGDEYIEECGDVEKPLYREGCTYGPIFYSSNSSDFKCVSGYYEEDCEEGSDFITCDIEGEIKEVDAADISKIRLGLTQTRIKYRGIPSDVACADIFRWSDEQNAFVVNSTENFSVGQIIKGEILLNISGEDTYFTNYSLENNVEIEIKQSLFQRIVNWIKNLFY